MSAEHDERCADLDAALDLLARLTRDYDDAANLYGPKPAVEVRYVDTSHTDEWCDWEHGVCVCPGCGKVVQVKPDQFTHGHPARVVDADNRPHFCGRYIAYVLGKAGVPGMGPLLARHAQRAPLPQVAPPPEHRNGHSHEQGSGL